MITPVITGGGASICRSTGNAAPLAAVRFRVAGPAGISARLVRYGAPTMRDPAHWYQNAEDRRAVLDTWLQTLVPFLSGYELGS